MLVCAALAVSTFAGLAATFALLRRPAQEEQHITYVQTDHWAGLN